MCSSPDGVSRFQYPGLARPLAVYCVDGLVLKRSVSSEISAVFVFQTCCARIASAEITRPGCLCGALRWPTEIHPEYYRRRHCLERCRPGHFGVALGACMREAISSSVLAIVAAAIASFPEHTEG